MSITSELDICVGELRSAARSLNMVADGLAALFSGSRSETTAQAQTEPSTTRPKPITLEQVRSVLADKARAGYTAEVRALLEKHGASKLSEIDPGEYVALLAEAEVLGNG